MTKTMLLEQFFILINLALNGVDFLSIFQWIKKKDLFNPALKDKHVMFKLLVG